MGPGPEGQVVPEPPVVQIVTGGPSLEAPGRDFVIRVAVLMQVIGTPTIDVPEMIVVGQFWRTAVKLGIGLEGQLVPGEMRWFVVQGSLDVLKCLPGRLARQTVHQIDIEVIEPGAASGAYGPVGGIGIVNSPQRFEMVGVETLDPDGETVDARCPESVEPAGFERAGVGFQGNFGICGEGKACPQFPEQAIVEVAAHQGRSAASDEHGLYWSIGGKGQVLVEIFEQSLQIGGFRDCPGESVGVEVTVGALPHAPGYVNIEAQRRPNRRWLLIVPGAGITQLFQASAFS